MKTLWTSIKLFAVLSILTGVLYPLLITGMAQLTFPSESNGSLIYQNGEIIGSKWIGQEFDRDGYFTARPSAISYQSLPSGGSNLGLTNKSLQTLVLKRTVEFRTRNGLTSAQEIPAEMVFASASGLDPHISPLSAWMQVERVAQARGMDLKQRRLLKELVQSYIEQPQLFVLGEKRLNVLLLNIQLDKSIPIK
jgi:potassium-transporting ATPase KdpC subunit